MTNYREDPTATQSWDQPQSDFRGYTSVAISRRIELCG